MTGRKFDTTTEAGKNEMSIYFEKLEDRIKRKELFNIKGCQISARSLEEAENIWKDIPSSFRAMAQRSGNEEIKCESIGGHVRVND
ncbi:hypothetical protein [Carboxylicivirga sp. RSCT41]|uniref:hypothetical protein n=1 Tax=Carboxylicivirga agarovorans TaxID=3417570 RepID=UPI003D33D9B2